MGRSLIAAEVFNCSAPDTGNMEVLHNFGTPAQQARWLAPLLAGEIRSAFAMTEPDVASSDATNIALPIVRDGDEFVLERPQVVDHRRRRPALPDPDRDGRDQPGRGDAPPPVDGAGADGHARACSVVRPLRVFGYDDAPHGHVEIAFDNVRVPVDNLIHTEGSGFEIAQARLGPGRIHHCMRLIGLAQRALEAMVARARSAGRVRRAARQARAWRRRRSRCRAARSNRRAC